MADKLQRHRQRQRAELGSLSDSGLHFLVIFFGFGNNVTAPALTYLLYVTVFHAEVSISIIYKMYFKQNILACIFIFVCCLIRMILSNQFIITATL